MTYGWSDDPFDFGLRAVSGYGSSYLYPLFVCAGLLLSVPAAWAVVRWARMISTGIGVSRRRRVGPEPWCRECGYSAFAAAGPRCSECGAWRSPSTLVRSSDLGPWRLERALAVGSMVAVWTAAMLALGIPLFDFLLEHLQPADCETQSAWYIHSTDGMKPLQLVVGRADGEDGTPPRGGIVLSRMRRCGRDRTPSPMLRFHQGSWATEFDTKPDASAEWPDPPAIEDWVRRVRVEANVDEPAVQSPAAREAFQAAAECLAGRPPDPTISLAVRPAYERTIRKPTWPATSLAVTMSAWILLWVVGATSLVRLRSRPIASRPLEEAVVAALVGSRSADRRAAELAASLEGSTDDADA